jgi:hypothetical protein
MVFIPIHEINGWMDEFLGEWMYGYFSFCCLGMEWIKKGCQVLIAKY